MQLQNKIVLEEFFKEHNLDEQKKFYFGTIKEEYSGGDGTLRDELSSWTCIKWWLWKNKI